jgi:hypothetical protein
LDIDFRPDAVMSQMSSDELQERLFRLRDLWLVLFGTGVGVLCAYGLMVVASGADPALWGFLLAAAIPIAMIAVAVKSAEWSVRLASCAAIASYVACLAYVVGNPLGPSDRATKIARDRSYCVQLARGALGVTGYRPAVSRLDLTGLTMRAAGFQFHAVMALEDERSNFDLYNWSYRKRDWMPLNVRQDAQPVISCRPQKGFVEALPLLTLTPGSGAVRQFGNRALLVSDRYSPKFQHDATMTLIARAPEFGPVSVCAEHRHCMLDMITVSLLPASGKVWFPQGKLTRIQEGSVEDGNATHVECASLDANARCSHKFVSNGLLFSFKYPHRELPRWREMQGNLLELYRSFEVRP